MSHDALHERISEWFEPKPGVVNTTFRGPDYSKAGAWRINWVAAPGKRWISEVAALDYTHDEAANARLLEAMPVVSVERHPNSKAWFVTTVNKYKSLTSDKDRKTAIRDAFCKWAGIEVEGK